MDSNIYHISPMTQEKTTLPNKLPIWAINLILDFQNYRIKM